MQIKTTTGTMAEITSSEAERIAAHVMGGKQKTKNAEYLARAKRNLSRLSCTEWPEEEDAKKEVLYEVLPGFTREEADFLYEVMEEVAASHYKHVAE